MFVTKHRYILYNFSLGTIEFDQYFSKLSKRDLNSFHLFPGKFQFTRQYVGYSSDNSTIIESTKVLEY